MHECRSLVRAAPAGSPILRTDTVRSIGHRTWPEEEHPMSMPQPTPEPTPKPQPGEPAPRLAIRPARGDGTRAVVLVLHGGQEHSLDPAMPRQSAALRMMPFAGALHRAGRPYGVAVWRLGYRYRGWNGDAASPVPDALW